MSKVLFNATSLLAKRTFGYYTSRVLSSTMTEAFKQHGVVPDVVDKEPISLAKISYPGNITLQISKELTPTQVKEQPNVVWDADSSAFYTLIFTDPDNFTDPDVPSRETPTYREWHHWLVGNIPGNDISKGDVLSAYIGSGPPEGTGLHRYIYLIYKQPGKINFDEERLTNTSTAGRAGFSAKKFVAKYNLGDPVAGNFYQAQFDDYVPLLYKQLGE